MSLKYLIRRRAVKVNRHRGIKIAALCDLGDSYHMLITAPGRGIGQHTISKGCVRSLKYNRRDKELDAALRI